MAEHRDPTGKAFERMVADMYRALGYHVTENIRLPGKQTDLIARQDRAGGPKATLTIECRDHASSITNEEVFQFIFRVTAQMQNKLVNGGVLVARHAFSADARAAAMGHEGYLSLLTWDELTAEVIDARGQLRENTRAQEQDVIFRHYVPPRARYIAWSKNERPQQDSAPIEELTNAWVAASAAGRPYALVMLADFGAGKTTLLQHVLHERALAYLDGEDPRIPLFVPLNRFGKTQDIKALLRESFRDAYDRDVPLDLLWARVRAGAFTLLLDGFDEMEGRTDAQRRAELFYQVMDIVQAPCPIMITSRKSYFVERRELDDLLGALRNSDIEVTAATGPFKSRESASADRIRRRLVQTLGPRARRLSPFVASGSLLVAQLSRLTPSDVESYLRLRRDELAEHSTTPGQVLTFMKETYDLLELATRPLLLRMIVESILDDSIDLSDTTQRLNATKLYDIYTQTKLDIDVEKRRDARQSGLALRVRLKLAEQAAVELYKRTSRSIDLEMLVKALFATLSDSERADMSEEELVTDFATCSFVEVDSNGECCFGHPSFRDFFVARHLAKDLDHVLYENELSREVLHFLGGFVALRERLGQALRDKVATTRDRVRPRRNWLVALLCGVSDHVNLKVREAQVSECDIESLTFTEPAFDTVVWRDSKLGVVRVHRPEWRNVWFEGSTVTALAIEEGTAELLVKNTEIETLSLTNTAATVGLPSGSITSASVRGGHLECDIGEAGSVKRLAADKCVINWHSQARGDEELVVRRTVASLSLAERCSVVLDESVARLVTRRGRVREDDLAEGDAQRFGAREVPRKSVGARLSGNDSLVLGMPKRGDGRWSETPLVSGLEEGCVLWSGQGVGLRTIAEARCGVFGRIEWEGRPRDTAFGSGAWGVLDAGHAIAVESVCRVHGLLLTHHDWYREATGPTGPLAVVSRAEAVYASWNREGGVDASELRRLLGDMRVAFETLAGMEWPELDDVLGP